VAAALVADVVAAAMVPAMDMAMGIDMAIPTAMSLRMVRMVTTNLTVSPGKISAKPAEGPQAMLVMGMATCKSAESAALQSQHTQQITLAVAMNLSAARLEQSSMVVVVKCCSIRIVTSLAIVSK